MEEEEEEEDEEVMPSKKSRPDGSSQDVFWYHCVTQEMEIIWSNKTPLNPSAMKTCLEMSPSSGRPRCHRSTFYLPDFPKSRTFGPKPADLFSQAHESHPGMDAK